MFKEYRGKYFNDISNNDKTKAEVTLMQGVIVEVTIDLLIRNMFYMEFSHNLAPEVSQCKIEAINPSKLFLPSYQ